MLPQLNVAQEQDTKKFSEGRLLFRLTDQDNIFQLFEKIELVFALGGINKTEIILSNLLGKQ